MVIIEVTQRISHQTVYFSEHVFSVTVGNKQTELHK